MHERTVVAIVNKSGGRALISADAYDSATMTLWDAPTDPAAAPEAQPIPEAAPKKKSGRWGDGYVKKADRG
jgi:hypothetical protein